MEILDLNEEEDSCQTVSHRVHRKKQVKWILLVYFFNHHVNKRISSKISLSLLKQYVIVLTDTFVDFVRKKTPIE